MYTYTTMLAFSEEVKCVLCYCSNAPTAWACLEYVSLARHEDTGFLCIHCFHVCSMYTYKSKGCVVFKTNLHLQNDMFHCQLDQQKNPLLNTKNVCTCTLTMIN